MIDREAYFKGRDVQYASELTPEIEANAAITIDKANQLLARANIELFHCNSGWRPQGVNDATANAAKGSPHLTAEGVDLPDSNRTLARWCADNLNVAAEIGLWFEDFRWTPTWVHCQIVPPKSGRRIFIPSQKPPLDPSFPVTWS